MKPEELKERSFDSEFVFLTSRSAGPGGQNVNKLNTKVELRFNLFFSKLFTETEKTLISEKLKNKINNKGELVIASQSERSQLLNKKRVVEKFYDLTAKALTIPKSRRSTNPTFASRVKRIEKKKQRGEIKKLRNPSSGAVSD